MQNQLYRHHCLHDSLEDSNYHLFTIVEVSSSSARRMYCLEGRRSKPPSKECWYVGRHTHDFDWLIFDWFNHVDYTLSYYYRWLPPPRQHKIDHIISRLQMVFLYLLYVRKIFRLDIQTRCDLDTATPFSPAGRPHTTSMSRRWSHRHTIFVSITIATVWARPRLKVMC